ncbi:MAG: response regulator transcription factor [Lachnospiraceae bacterium]|nr:response regulator transcription factor [Lachnospiraceae bacterium]MBR4767508.1 response regulator transcription factor [Lachnospiraceae bacterium]
MNILLVEDETSLSNAVKRILERSGDQVDQVFDGLSALDYARAKEYDLIILDVMLPKLDGFEVLRILRKDKTRVPILMLTARSSVKDKVAGLNGGADDYLTKPFDTEELIARVGALTRRTGDVVIDEIRFGDLRLNVHTALLSNGERSVQLSKKEFEVMRLFLSNPDNVITKDSLLSRVWGMDSDATDNNVEVYISFLRKKLKYLQADETIRNIQKIGYRLEAVS